jgi:hypothetical protein
MVCTALGFKDATDLLDAVICLIIAERRSDPPAPLSPRFADLHYAECGCVHMRSTRIVPQDITVIRAALFE